MIARSCPIFLVGFMGSGKSAAGNVLATLLGWDFVDTDRSVEEREGRSIATIFRESGEGRFREVEWDVARGLDGRERVVVATGGGLFLGWEQRRWLKRRGLTVWLDVPLDVARARLGGGKGRPLWDPADPLALRVLFENRRAIYALAEVRIPASSGDPTGLARRVIDRLRSISR